MTHQRVATICANRDVNTISNRLKQRRKELGLSQKALAARAGVAPGTVGNLETGLRKNPRALLKLAKALGLQPLWLQEEKGPRLDVDQDDTKRYRPDTEIGTWLALKDAKVIPTIKWESLMFEKLRGVFRVAMPDDSMAPRVKAGAFLVFSAGEKPRAGDGVLVTDREGRTFFRVYRERRPGEWEAQPLNDAYQALDSKRDGLKVLAVLTAVESRWS